MIRWKPVEYLIPKGKHLPVQEGDFIEKGEYILDGNPAPHDILAIKGVEELASFLVNEIQEVYRLQGVSINDKHIEVIVRQMLQKVEITDAGESTLLVGEQVDHVELDTENDKLIADGRKPASGVPVLLGITKASLADAVVHLGGVLPGNHAGSHRSRGSGQDRYARRPQGKRHRRPPHSGRHGRHAGAVAPGCRQARRHDPRRAGPGGSSASGGVRFTYIVLKRPGLSPGLFRFLKGTFAAFCPFELE